MALSKENSRYLKEALSSFSRLCPFGVYLEQTFKLPMAAIHRYRTVLFLLFVGVFFVTASSVVFYAFGYRFSFERGIFIYTGSLSLKTNVQTVNIKIDGTAIPEKRLGLLNNSIHLTGLNPGEHLVEVSAPGYQPWSKKTVIQSGLATEFWSIFLVRDTYEQVPVPGTDTVIKMFPAPNGLFATVKKNGNRYAVDVLDTKADTDNEVFSTTDALFLPTFKTNIEWSPESHKLIIPLIKNDQPIYAVVTIKTKEVFYLNDAVHIATPLQAPRWDATTKDHLFFLNQDVLYRFDTSSPETATEVITDHVTAYDISGKNLYYLNDQNGVVYQMNGNDTNGTPRQITSLPIILDLGHPYSLIAYNETRVSVIDEKSGALFVYNGLLSENVLKELEQGVQGIQYSDDGKKLLFFTDNEVSVYFNEAWQTQPIRAQDSVIQIARFSTPIKNVQWAKDYEHVIFSLDKSIKMVELDSRDRRALADLMTLNVPPLQVLPRLSTDTLYIVRGSSSDTNTVVSIALLQYTSFFGL